MARVETTSPRYATREEAEAYKTEWLGYWGAEPGSWDPYQASAYVSEDPVDGPYEKRFRVVCFRYDSCD